jgi:hypothetical protein
MCMLAPQWAGPSSQMRIRDVSIGLRLAVELNASQCEKGLAVGTGSIAEVVDADETSGQHMLAKSDAGTR